ncbi:MAG: hypothetical protein WC714_18260 [Candidatus Obscuribacterales bacterium]|jgi:hypothetical protein
MNSRSSPSSPLAEQRSPSQLLQEARDLFAIGICIDAAVMANAAIAVMKDSLSFAANNPKLADAYALLAAICTEVRKNYHGVELKQDYLQHTLDAYRAEIACRQLGCETEALAKAHYFYGRTLAADLGDSRGYQEIAKAMKILANLAERDGDRKTPWL